MHNKGSWIRVVANGQAFVLPLEVPGPHLASSESEMSLRLLGGGYVMKAW